MSHLFPAFDQSGSTSSETSLKQSLFPAFASGSKDECETQDEKHEDWLCNPSFKPDAALKGLEVSAVKDRARSRSPILSKYEEGKHVLGSASENDNESGHEASSKHKHKKQHKHKHRHKKHEADSSLPGEQCGVKHVKEPEPVKATAENTKGKVFIEDVAGLTAQHAYRLDRKPDKNNVVFGEPYRLHVAKFQQVGHSCVGLKSHQEWLWRKKSKHKKSTPNHGRYYAKENRIKDGREPVLDLSVDAIGNKIPDITNSSFIQVDHGMQQGGKSEVNPLGIYDKSTELYLQGKGSIEYSGVSTAPVYKQSLEEVIKQKTQKLNTKLRENPQDIETWIELVNFQNEAHEYSTDEYSKRVTDETLGKSKKRDSVINEIKAAILKRALEANPKSIRLKLFQFEVCRDIWDTEKLVEEWRNLVFVHINDISVWQMYLLFVQSQFSKFTVSLIVKAYAKCLSSLQSLVEGTLKSHQCQPGTKEAMLDIFIQLCHTLKQAGHTERAVSLCQAMLEYNLCCPASLVSLPWRERLELLEAYWDSGVSHVGEDGARGWAYWLQHQEEQQPTKPFGDKAQDEEIEESLLEHEERKKEAWVAIETSRISRHWFPWKPDTEAGETEEDCEDPERIVLFDDLKSCIFPVTDSKEQFRLVKLFLLLLDVTVHQYRPKRDFDNCFGNIVDRFENIGLVSNLKLGGPSLNVDANQQSQFVENMISLVRPTLPEKYQTDLLVILLQLKKQSIEQTDYKTPKERKSHWKELKKLAKSILKEEKNRNNLSLWECYAEIEKQSGQLDEAVRILETALSMFGKDSVSSRDPNTACLACKLYRACCEMILFDSPASAKAQQENKAVYVLVSLASSESYKPAGSVASPAMILKARRDFQQKLEHFLQFTQEGIHSEGGPAIVHYTVCYAIFQYVTVSIDAAGIVFENVISSLQNKLESAFLVEELRENHLVLIEKHMSRNIAPASKLRIPLEQALQKYPNNTVLLKMFVELEIQANIAGRLRKYFHRATRDSTTVIPWLFSVYSEFLRLQKLRKYQEDSLVSYGHTEGEVNKEIGVTHRIRSLLEGAVQHPKAQHCVLLWRVYMQFEVEQGKLHHAKLLFFRSLQLCPWAKELYMDAVRLFPDQLQVVLDLMVEKEIRLRTPLEELELLLANRPGQGVEEEGGGEMGEDGDQQTANWMQVPREEEIREQTTQQKGQEAAD